MELRVWVDVFPWSKEENLFPTTVPIIPKPVECKRYLISCNIPMFDGDADHIIEPKIIEE